MSHQPSGSGGSGSLALSVIEAMTTSGSTAPPRNSRASPTNGAWRRRRKAPPPKQVTGMANSATGRSWGATLPKANTTNPNTPTNINRTPR